MKKILLRNWKAKFASLLLAVAVWFLIRSNIREQIPPEIPVPGTQKFPVPETPVPSPIPGVPGGISEVFPPAYEQIELAAMGVFYRLHWIEAGDFAASLVEFPARMIL